MTRASNFVLASTAPPTANRWWLKDPIDAKNAMQLSLQPRKLKMTFPDPQQIVFPLGSPAPVIMRDTIKLPTITLPLRFLSEQEFLQFHGLWALGRVLLLQAPVKGRQWYVVIGDNTQLQLDLAAMRGWMTGGYDPNSTWEDISCTMQVVASP